MAYTERHVDARWHLSVAEHAVRAGISASVKMEPGRGRAYMACRGYCYIGRAYMACCGYCYIYMACRGYCYIARFRQMDQVQK